jgi:hypothetical protein
MRLAQAVAETRRGKRKRPAGRRGATRR